MSRSRADYWWSRSQCNVQNQCQHFKSVQLSNVDFHLVAEIIPGIVYTCCQARQDGCACVCPTGCLRCCCGAAPGSVWCGVSGCPHCSTLQHCSDRADGPPWPLISVVLSAAHNQLSSASFVVYYLDNEVYILSMSATSNISSPLIARH